MAERYSLKGEVEHAWRRFWELGWKWKAPSIGIVGLVLIGMIGAATENEPPPAAPDVQAEPSSSPGATSTNPPTSTPTTTATPSAEPTRTPTSTPPPTATATPAPPEWISGLDVRDITGNLENRGFDCTGPTELQTLRSWDCSNSTGEIVVSVLGRDATHIRTIDATVFFFIGTPSDEAAADFLGFIATVPYDDGSPAEARAWVEMNIASGAETVFGSANFQIYGPPTARSLQIVAVGAN